MPEQPEDSLEVEIFAEMRRRGEAYTLLDVRDPDEIEICAFEESLNIPMQEVPANVDRLPREGPLVVVCHLGQRSGRVAAWLRQNGFANAVNLSGGIDAWAREIDNDMNTY